MVVHALTCMSQCLCVCATCDTQPLYSLQRLYYHMVKLLTYLISMMLYINIPNSLELIYGVWVGPVTGGLPASGFYTDLWDASWPLYNVTFEYMYDTYII